MRIWSCLSKPRSSAVRRARWRATTTSASSRIATVRIGQVMGPLRGHRERPPPEPAVPGLRLEIRHAGGSWPLSGSDQHGDVVAAAGEVAVEHAGDEARVTEAEAGVAVERPVRAESVRAQDDEGNAGEVVGELVD